MYRLRKIYFIDNYIIASFGTEPCPKGTYSDVWSNPNESICRSCPKGTYQNETGQERCISCPTGFVTLQANSTHISDCIGECSYRELFFVDGIDRTKCSMCKRFRFSCRKQKFHICKECRRCMSWQGYNKSLTNYFFGNKIKMDICWVL